MTRAKKSGERRRLQSNPHWRKDPNARGWDIGIGGGKLWGVGIDRNVYEYLNGNWVKRPAVPGTAKYISVDGRGFPWVVANNYRIYKWSGSGWLPNNGLARDIGVNSKGEVWVIGLNGTPGGYGIYRRNGNSWTNIPGGAVRIAVGPRGAWVVNSGNYLFEYSSGKWITRSTCVKDVGVGSNGVVWAVGCNR